MLNFWPKVTIILVFTAILCSVYPAVSKPLSEVAEIEKDSRCPVCGMFVAKYPNWLSQLLLSNGRSEAFDGVKDMMAYYFAPQNYGLAEGITVAQVQVKDYYSQNWIDGRAALYVIGSDVHGPMGHELIAFETRPAAENFMQDHAGKKILEFSEITEELIDSMRKGHTMKGHSSSGKK